MFNFFYHELFASFSNVGSTAVLATCLVDDLYVNRCIEKNGYICKEPRFS